jgi:glycosyltransferase involved in cell wall biosynthesis
MRIMQTESSMGLGGRELAVLAMAEGLVRRGHHVVLAIQPGSLLQESARERKILYECIGMSKLKYPLAVWAFRQQIRRHGIEVIHTHSSRDRWMAAIAAHGCSPRPAVVLGRHHCGTVPNSFVNWMGYTRLSHCIVTTGGERLRQELIDGNGFSPSRVVSIPTGVDLTRFTADVDGSVFRSELNLPHNTVLVGAVAYLHEYKGLRYFIEAAGLVLEKAPMTRFVIVGDGPERERLRAQIDRAGANPHVLMVGHRDDVPHVMAGLDICVVSSTGTETLTQVIPQALAMGKPVVATDVGGISDVVVNQVTGLLVPPRDAKVMAEAILWMMSQKEEGRRFAQAGRCLVMERYSLEVAVHRTERLYEELLEGMQSKRKPRGGGCSEEPPKGGSRQ